MKKDSECDRKWRKDIVLMCQKVACFHTRVCDPSGHEDSGLPRCESRTGSSNKLIILFRRHAAFPYVTIFFFCMFASDAGAMDASLAEELSAREEARAQKEEELRRRLERKRRK